MLSKMCRAILLGAPASGKGTISKRIVEKFGFTHISPGDMLRLEVANGTELGKKAKFYIDQGELVPDDIVMKFVIDHIKKIDNKSWLIDGFPRSLKQAIELDANTKIDAVMNLQVPYEVIIDRVRNRWIHLPSGRVYNIGFNDPKTPGKDDITGEDLVQRPDDQPEVVANRLEVYSAMMKPIIAYYTEKGIIVNFKGSETSTIWPKIEKYLNEKFVINNKNCE